MTRRSKWIVGTVIVAAVLVATVLVLNFKRHSPRIIYDYAAGPEGRVVDTAGHPIASATVTVVFDETVFEAVSPRRSTRVTTDQLGRFQAVLIACDHPGGTYTLTVEKNGYNAARVRGSGVGFHRVALAPASFASP